MRILLDENFPLLLYHRLKDAGHQAEHIIILGRRGESDSVIRRQLADEEDLVFLTQDTEFESLARNAAATVIISRVPQVLPIAARVELWLEGITEFLERPPVGRLFELLPSGEVVGLLE